jgi:hypothetical protein
VVRAGTGLVIVGALVAGLAGRADAQMRGREDRAVFGGGVGSADQLLSIRSNIGATFHDPIGEIAPALGSRRIVERAWFGHASTMLSYQYTRPYLTVRAVGGAFSYYQPTADSRWYSQYNADAQASSGHTFRFSPRASLRLEQAVVLRPSYFTAGLSGVFASGTGDFSDPSLYLPPEVASIGGREFGSSSSATVQYDVSRRTSVQASYWFDRIWTFDTPPEFDFARRSHRATVHSLFSLTRHLRLRAGYRFTRSEALGPGAPIYRENSADLGVDYDRGGTIQLSRRTQLSFGGGASAFADSRGERRFFVLGNAVLSHEIGRTWSAAAGYRRHVDFSVLYQEPVLSDTATAEIGGLVTRYLRFRAGGAYSAGRVGFTGDNNELRRVAALAELQTSLNRYLALGVNYTYYRHQVGGAVLVRSEFAGLIEGQSVRVFLSAWAPVFHRVRRPDAAR